MFYNHICDSSEATKAPIILKIVYDDFRKAVKATVVLLPLFGLHFFITIYRPSWTDCKWVEIYMHFNYLLDGLQGVFVATVFCFCNGEVSLLHKPILNGFK